MPKYNVISKNVHSGKGDSRGSQHYIPPLSQDKARCILTSPLIHCKLEGLHNFHIPHAW